MVGVAAFTLMVTAGDVALAPSLSRATAVSAYVPTAMPVTPTEYGAVVSVPVHHRARERGTSNSGVHNRLWVGIVDLFGVAWLQRRVRLPLIEPDSDL